MNPLMCPFGVTEGKFLGFFVYKEGIKIDQDKARVVYPIKLT